MAGGSRMHRKLLRNSRAEIPLTKGIRNSNRRSARPGGGGRRDGRGRGVPSVSTAICFLAEAMKLRQKKVQHQQNIAWVDEVMLRGTYARHLRAVKQHLRRRSRRILSRFEGGFQT